MATKKKICKAIRLIAAQLEPQTYQTGYGLLFKTNPYRRMKRAVKRGQNIRSVIVKHSVIGDRDVISKEATRVSYLTRKFIQK